MFVGFRLVPMFLLKDFVRDCFIAQICAKMCVRAGIRAYLRDPTKQSGTKSLSTNIGTIPTNMPTNLELKRLKPKLHIVKKPENRVHELTGRGELTSEYSNSVNWVRVN